MLSSSIYPEGLYRDGKREFPKVKETTQNLRLHYFQYENQRFIGGIIMAQNLTYTQCGDYYIPDIRLHTREHSPLANMAE